jgi:ABC-type multidrug transport system ATPase subunit
MNGFRVEAAATLGQRGNMFSLRVPDLHLGGGTATALVGKSGSGKTTLLSALLGLAGKAAFRPHIPTMGAVMHAPLLFPWLTLGEMVRLEERARGVENNSSLLSEGLSAFRLMPDILTHRSWEISQGMRQRFEIAKAIAFEPELLLLDEAFSGIDGRTRIEVLRFIDQRIQEGLGLLFVTHDIGDVMRLADSIIVIEEGCVIADIDPGRPRRKRLNLSGAELIRLPAAEDLASRMF